MSRLARRSARLRARRPADAPTAPDYAGFVSRLLALLVDLGVIVVSAILYGWTSTLLLRNPPTTWFLALLDDLLPQLMPLVSFLISPAVRIAVAVSFGFLYFVLFPLLTGQTIGKRLLGLRVVSADGQRIRVGQALLRTVGYLASAFPLYLGFLAVLVDDQRRSWHDRLSGTCVVYAWDARPDERFLARAIRHLDGS